MLTKITRYMGSLYTNTPHAPTIITDVVQTYLWSSTVNSERSGCRRVCQREDCTVHALVNRQRLSRKGELGWRLRRELRHVLVA